ncbi:MAG: hypothetical protein J5858_11465 [Lentisphaeria bacterium]|nr:hypothetical protein [Lentisphaeria bacterium]
MNVKPLQHYHRKKFYYRFFMRKSPRAGTMFGLAWIYMTACLVPFALLAAISCFGDSFSFGITLFAGAGITLLLAIPVYLYGAVLCALGLMKICLPVFRFKSLADAAGGLAALVPSLLGVILLPVLIVRKRFAAAFFALAATLAFGVYSFAEMKNILLVFIAGGICLFAALAGVEDKHRFSWRFMIPLGIAAAAHLFLLGYDGKLQMDIKSEREKLSQVVGRSVEIEDIWAREAGGIPIDREPVKTLIAQKPESVFLKKGDHPLEAARNELRKIHRENPLFVKALDECLKLPPDVPFAHQQPEDGLLAGVLLSEVDAIRQAAYFLALKIIVEAKNKTKVREYSRNLTGIRDRMLKNNSLICHLMALAVENIRLDALEAVLAGGTFAKGEFAELVGGPVDWNRYLRYSYGDEAALFKNTMDHILSKAAMGGGDKNLVRMKKYLPIFLHVHFLRDYRFALRTFTNACSIPTTLSGLEKARLAAVDEQEIKRNHYFLSGMLLPALETVYEKDAQTADLRQMVLLGAEVMEYRRKTGKLPRDLTFLPQVPSAELDHRSIMYETTPDGFRLYTHTRDGKIPAADDLRYAFKVRLHR